ncbi:uncharacterized protein EV154DRAFT_489696 [Mucor mucedo]|uniref:uncharacterized protein n=1 Tax=Mucor mucedo TaxID=29922 RepID=UPI00221E44AB|nr:uncharacterized protein EV154DRAFT_489696 [Mucor mucedo]KAI7897325.1 hypothetical protein EV154DRAFT_489696 [Mucor mucedo]
MVNTRKNRLLPVWVFKLVGFSSLATALIGVAIYLFKKYPPRRKLTREPAENTSEHVPIATQKSSWSKGFFGVRKNKKKMTISLKNTVLWNPSPDVNTPMYAFQENSIQILTRLSCLYDIYVIVHVNSEEEKGDIQRLLENASSTDGLFVDGVDNRKIIFCSEEEGKIHIIRHIEPHMHVEGGWEKDDGEDIIQKLKPFVSKLIWIQKRKDAPSHPNVELADLLMHTSIAQQVKDA